VNGRYAGVNVRAIIALLLGVIPNLPGFLAQIGWVHSNGFWVSLYNYAWFIGLAISSLVYWLLMYRNSNKAEHP